MSRRLRRQFGTTTAIVNRGPTIESQMELQSGGYPVIQQRERSYLLKMYETGQFRSKRSARKL